MSSETEIRPFRVDMAEETITNLRRLTPAPRRPSTRNWSQIGRRACSWRPLQELARYWAADYDWRACEETLNALPMFKTEIDGVDVHFIQVKSPHADALPLIMTHGWPGSVIEMLGVIGPLTNRPRTAAQRGRVRPRGAVHTRVAFLPSRPRSAGTSAASRRRGRS